MRLLRNKSTGEIGCLVCAFEKTPEKITVVQYVDGKRGSKVWYYNSLAELNEEWEDYEEPKKYYVINPVDWKEVIGEIEYRNDNTDKINREIGNYFETKEEAEKTVEKLKAWKRLKDFGCRFILDDHFAVKFIGPDATKITSAEEQGLLSDAYKLLFGGEE